MPSRRKRIKREPADASPATRTTRSMSARAAPDQTPKAEPEPEDAKPSTSPPSSSGLGVFFPLPGELRNMIYREALTFDAPIDVTQPKPIAGLLGVSRQIRDEARPFIHVFYQENTFRFPIEEGDSQTAQNWSRVVGWASRLSVNGDDADNVRTVELVRKCATSTAMWDAVVAALSTQCTGITKVQVNIDWSDIAAAMSWWDTRQNHVYVWRGLEAFQNLTVVDMLAHDDERWMNKFQELHPDITLRLCSIDGEVIRDYSV